MQINKIKAGIEAILFSVGDSLTIEKIAESVELDLDTTKKIINIMMDEYGAENRGIKIVELGGAYQLCTKKTMYPFVKNLVHKDRTYELTDVQIETLSIIAYKQPVTKAYIESVRGVKSDHAVNKLIEYGLVEEVGRMQTLGRPILFGTTQDFFRVFALNGEKDLRDLEEKALEALEEVADD